MKAVCVALSLLFIHWSTSQVLTVEPKTDIFVTPQVVGSDSSGTSVSMYGCTGTGATLSTITLWANADYIRGMSASLTDGTEVMYGCVNVTSSGQNSGGCNDTDTRTQSFTFQPGERVTGMTLWAGYNSQKVANQRAGALNFITSKERTFDFGMIDARSNPVSVALGSGIPCGVAPRAGADIDALGFVFLRSVNSSLLDGVTYEGVSGNPIHVDGSGFDGNATIIVLSQQIYNNSNQNSSLVASFASNEPAEQTASWSIASGVDSYLTSSVNAALPIPAANTTATDPSSWSLGGITGHTRSGTTDVLQTWNYTVNVAEGGVSQVAATAVQSYLATTFTGTLNITLDSGAFLSIPVTGIYEGESTSPVSITTTVIQAGKSSTTSPTPNTTASTSSGGASTHSSNNTLAWVLGVLLGVVGGLLLAALIAWAVVLIMRRRRRDGGRSTKGASGGAIFMPGVGKWSQFKGTEGTEGVGKDVEMGSAGQTGKEASSVGKSQCLKTVMGVPVDSEDGAGPSREAENPRLPESEGTFVVPYNMFRRLRLDNIRHALGLAEQEKGADTGKHETVGASYTPPRNTPEGLSSPPSGASTPRAISTSPLSASHNPSGAATPSSNLDEDQKSETGAVEGMTATPIPFPRSPRLGRLSGGGPRAADSSRLKDRVAIIMAQRKAAAENVTAPEVAADAPSDERIEAREEPSMFKRMGKSLSNLTSRQRGVGKEDRGETSLLGRPTEASPAARAAPPSPDAAIISTPQTTPRGSDIMQHDDVGLILGEGYQTPAAAESVPKDAVDLDGERVKLGVKYRTQGRNG